MLERAARTNALLAKCDDLLKSERFIINYEGELHSLSMILQLLNYLINNHKNEYDEDIIGDWFSRNCLALREVEKRFRPVDPSSEKMKKILPHARDLIKRMG